MELTREHVTVESAFAGSDQRPLPPGGKEIASTAPTGWAPSACSRRRDAI